MAAARDRRIFIYKKRAVATAGLFGPWIIIGLMTFAVVTSPIPSAPIAMAAGAAYRHIYGTVYVVIPVHHP
ncbi:MAG: hypothetical protein COB39_01420 [Marinosulfonomonas sp.]|nr:MAG: hypothetical protein COB39_01420 [Marinosulfonomonas sp.]